MVRGVHCQTSHVLVLFTAGMDYTSVNQTITVPAGNISFPITIRIRDDSIGEETKEFQVQLSIIPSTPSGVMTTSPNPTTVRIIDNDGT